MSWDDDEEPRDDIDIYDRETGKPRICAQQCATCIMNPNSPFRKGPGQLRPGRVPQMLRDAIRTQGYVICHSTFGQDSAAVCAGVAKVVEPQVIRIALRFGGVIEVNPDQKESKP